MLFFFVCLGDSWYYRPRRYDKGLERLVGMLAGGVTLDAAIVAVPGLVSRETALAVAVGQFTNDLPESLRRLPERNRFFKGLASWIGFKQLRVDYEPAKRTHGPTSWSPYTLIGLSIEGLTSVSVAPLRPPSLLGLRRALGAFALD